MMNVTLVRQDESVGEVNIALGEVIFGRGPLLGCTDKRVSHQHARMKVSEEGHIILEAIHTNPLFYIKGENPPVELTKSDFVVVSDGDEFSLVPDSYRFRVVIPSQVDSNHNGHIEGDDSTAQAQSPDHTYKRQLPAWMINIAKGGESNSNVKASHPQKREDEISDENLVNKKLKVASEDSGALGEDSSLGDDHDVPGSKLEPERTKLHEMSDDEEGGDVRDLEVKTEIEESCEDMATSAAQAGDPSTAVTNQGTGNVQRRSCMYGAKCYRKNTHHRVEFSHPGDPDYDDTDLPECPYGTACYRKNKQHRFDFKHTTKPRQAKKPQSRQMNPAADDEDDYDYDDPFLNDASSDDYQPTDTGSDISDVMSSGEEEADTKRMMKEAKKFARKK